MTDELSSGNAAASASGNSVLPDDIVETVAVGSVFGISGQPSSLSNLAYSNAIANVNLTQQNTVANQQAMNQVGESVLGKTVNLVTNLRPLEAAAAVKLDTGNDIAEKISDLKAAIVAGQSATVASTPLVPPPLNVQSNPGGGSIITATIAEFPITLALASDRVNITPPARASGTQVRVDSGNFPIEIRVAGQPPKPIGTIANVSRFRFPFTVDIDKGDGPFVKEESKDGPSTLIVAEGKFPVKINLTPE